MRSMKYEKREEVIGTRKVDSVRLKRRRLVGDHQVYIAYYYTKYLDT